MWFTVLPNPPVIKYKINSIVVVAKEQDSDDEQIDKGITLKSKSIMQKTLYFLKKMK